MASKDFSNKLKSLRLKAGYSQKDVYEHFKIPQSTFSSWEVGKSEPSGEMLIKLCEFYKCDMVKEFSSDNDITYIEWDMLEKYRALDPHGKEMVDFTLLKEWELSTAEAEKSNVVPLTLKEDTTYYVNAAHPIEDATEEDKLFDENLMDDENF